MLKKYTICLLFLGIIKHQGKFPCTRSIRSWDRSCFVKKCFWTRLYFFLILMNWKISKNIPESLQKNLYFIFRSVSKISCNKGLPILSICWKLWISYLKNLQAVHSLLFFIVKFIPLQYTFPTLKIIWNKSLIIFLPAHILIFMLNKTRFFFKLCFWFV